jgi:hypothetical protein
MLASIEKYYKNHVWFRVNVYREKNKSLFLSFEWFYKFTYSNHTIEKVEQMDKRNFKYPLNITIKRLTDKKEKIIYEWLKDNKEKFFNIYQDVYEKDYLNTNSLKRIIDELKL